MLVWHPKDKIVLIGCRSDIAFKQLSTEGYCVKTTAISHTFASTDCDSD